MPTGFKLRFQNNPPYYLEHESNRPCAWPSDSGKWLFACGANRPAIRQLPGLQVKTAVHRALQAVHQPAIIALGTNHRLALLAWVVIVKPASDLGIDHLHLAAGAAFGPSATVGKISARARRGHKTDDEAATKNDGCNGKSQLGFVVHLRFTTIPGAAGCRCSSAGAYLRHRA